MHSKDFLKKFLPASRLCHPLLLYSFRRKFKISFLTNYICDHYHLISHLWARRSSRAVANDGSMLSSSHQLSCRGPILPAFHQHQCRPHHCIASGNFQIRKIPQKKNSFALDTFESSAGYLFSATTKARRTIRL